jgi:hypothetical protein
MKPFIALLAGLAFADAATPALAEDVLNRHSWNFRVHNNPLSANRAATMWQVEHLGGGGGVGAGVGGAAAGSMPSVGSVANMNVITVVVGENGSADVAVEAEQQNLGDLDATAITSIGDDVDITQTRD